MSEESVEIRDVKGDVVTATGASNIVGKEVTIKGNVIQLVNPSPEAIERLREIAAMPTEVQPGSTAGIEGSKTPQISEQTQRGINEIINLLKGLEKHGKEAKEVVAGGMHLSRVEMLTKQAVLLKTEADQMLLDHAGKNRGRMEAGGYQVDFYELYADFDESAWKEKLQQANALLEEANRLDPTNTEVLLHIAQLLIVLTPDDPSDEQRLLYRIQNLLNTPKNDAERFRLAQATFLLATTHEPIQTESLRDARSMFEKLGRPEWVRQCDDILSAAGTGPAVGRGIPFTQPAPAPFAPPGFAPFQKAQPPAAFQPPGRWQIQITDGTQMSLELHPDGSFQAVQYVFGMNVQGTGQWVFSPYNNMLQLQGLINGFQPFMLGIMVQGPQAGGYYGIGTDGHGYLMLRA